MTDETIARTSKDRSERSEMLELLRAIKSVFAGDAAPHWVNKYETTMMRGRFLDQIDYFLDKPPPSETPAVAATKDIGDLLMAITTLRQKTEDAEVLAKHVWDTATALKANPPRKTRYCDYDLCPATFDPAHGNNDH